MEIKELRNELSNVEKASMVFCSTFEQNQQGFIILLSMNCMDDDEYYVVNPFCSYCNREAEYVNPTQHENYLNSGFNLELIPRMNVYENDTNDTIKNKILDTLYYYNDKLNNELTKIGDRVQEVNMELFNEYFQIMFE